MTNRTTALKALTAAGALVVLAACGSSGGSGGTTSGGGTSGGGTSAGTPVHGGKLTFAAVQDAQSMNNTTVFDNNSIWIFEQIFQPLYTVTPRRQERGAAAGHQLQGVLGQEDLHVHPAARA